MKIVYKIKSEKRVCCKRKMNHRFRIQSFSTYKHARFFKLDYSGKIKEIERFVRQSLLQYLANFYVVFLHFFDDYLHEFQLLFLLLVQFEL